MKHELTLEKKTWDVLCSCGERFTAPEAQEKAAEHLENTEGPGLIHQARLEAAELENL